jgi:peptidyl-prolyl cis-trans isomerase C
MMRSVAAGMPFRDRLVCSILQLILGCLVLTGSALAAEGLAINGQAIPAIKLEALLSARVSAGQKDDAQTRIQAREELIRHEALLQAALKAGVDNPLLQAQGQYAAETLKVRSYLQQWIKQNPIGQEAIAKEYEALKTRMGKQEVQMRQILLGTEDDARKLLGQLASGGKFEDLAQLVSKDVGTKSSGGLLPWVPEGTLVPVIAQEIGKLTPGQTTATPVRTPNGFHVIRLEGRRPFALPPLAQLQNQIQQNLETQAVDAHINRLRDQAQVK